MPLLCTSLLSDSGGLCSRVVREALLLLKTPAKEGLQGREQDKSRMVHQRHIHAPGIQPEPRRHVPHVVAWRISLCSGILYGTIQTEGVTHRLRLLLRAQQDVDDAATSSMLRPYEDSLSSSAVAYNQKSDGPRLMMHDNDTPLQLNRLYEEFFERGLQYFFPFATFQPFSAAPPGQEEAREGNAAISVLSLPWLGAQYAIHNPVPFTAHDVRMLDSVRAVLTARYHMLRDADRTGLDVERFW